MHSLFLRGGHIFYLLKVINIWVMWPKLTISVDQTRECYTTKIPTCFLVSFFHLLYIKSTGLLLCH